MKKIWKYHLISLFALTLILIFQNCSPSGKASLPTQNINGITPNGYCQIYAPSWNPTTNTATISFFSNLPQGTIYFTVLDTNSGFQATVSPANIQVNGAENSSVQTSCSPSHNYSITATWQADGYQSVGCNSTSFAAPSGDDGGGVTTCTAQTINNCTLGETQESTTAVSGTCATGYTGSCSYTCTSNTTDGGWMVSNNTCTSNSGSGDGGSGTNNCPAATLGALRQCTLPTSPVSTTPVHGTCSEDGSQNCAYICTSSGWVLSSNSCPRDSGGNL